MSIHTHGLAVLVSIALLAGCQLSTPKRAGSDTISVDSFSPALAPVGNTPVTLVFLGRHDADDESYHLAFEDAVDDLDLGRQIRESGIPYEVLGNGVFRTQVSSTLSGSRTLIIRDLQTEEWEKVALQFVAGDPVQLRLVDVARPRSVGNELGQVVYKLVVTDRYGNATPNPAIEASAGFGDVSIVIEEDMSAVVTVDANGYGRNTISLHSTALGMGSQITDSVFFDAIAVQHEAAYPTDGAATRLPIETYFPQAVCQGLRDIRFELTVPAGTALLGVQLNSKYFSGSVESLRLANDDTRVAFNVRPVDDIISQGGCKYPAGDLYLGPIEPQTHYRVAGGGYTLITENEQAEEGTCNEGVECEVRQVTITDTHLIIVNDGSTNNDPTYGTGKEVRNFCLDFIVSPHVDDAVNFSIPLLVRKTEEIYEQNAANCHCPYFARIESYRIHFLSDEEWRASFAKRGNKKRVNPRKVERWLDNPGDVTYQRRGLCTPVFIADLPNTKRGRHYRDNGLDYDNAENFVVIDHKKGFEDSMRTLAHEMGHAFSNGDVVDSAHQHADAQGANRNGNLYNYKGSGTNINASQCQMMDWNHQRFNR